jgi:hypothetical protein
MSRPRRRGGPGQGAGQGPGQGQGQKKDGGANGQARTPRRDFWGKELTDDERIDRITIADDPTTVVKSLGPPPLVGRDGIAEHYFDAVYEKAAGVAAALAAAGGVLAPDDDD